MTTVLRALLCGSVPPEWGGATGGGVATFHRTFIEELLARPGQYRIEVAGLLPFNLDPTSPCRPPVANVVVPPGDPAGEAGFYADLLATTRADLVVFQHIGHRWAVHHARLRPTVPALGVVHSWHAITCRGPDAAARSRRTVERALPSCDHLVFVSEHARAEGERLGFRYPGKVSVIGNPLGSAFTAEFPVTAHARRGWVFLGSLIDRKNPLAALDAAARCGAGLTVIGEGPLEADLRAHAARLGIADRLRLTGWARPEQVRQTLLRAELMCLPSTSESFGLAYTEALACGTPIVGPQVNVDDFARRIGMRVGAALGQLTAERIAAAALEVQATAWDRPELRRRTVAQYSPQAVVTAYTELMHELAG